LSDPHQSTANMFSVGRFDPREEVHVEPQKVKESKNASEKSSDKNTLPNNEEMEIDMDELIKSKNNLKAPGHESDGNSSSSSSAPSSDASSSSAPSSDEETDDEDGPSMKVIAPEQEYMGVGGTKRKHGNLTDEGMDDFDETEEINVQKKSRSGKCIAVVQTSHTGSGQTVESCAVPSKKLGGR